MLTIEHVWTHASQPDCIHYTVRTPTGVRRLWVGRTTALGELLAAALPVVPATIPAVTL